MALIIIYLKNQNSFIYSLLKWNNLFKLKSNLHSSWKLEFSLQHCDVTHVQSIFLGRKSQYLFVLWDLFECMKHNPNSNHFLKKHLSDLIINLDSKILQHTGYLIMDHPILIFYSLFLLTFLSSYPESPKDLDLLQWAPNLTIFQGLTLKCYLNHILSTKVPLINTT